MAMRCDTPASGAPCSCGRHRSQPGGVHAVVERAVLNTAFPQPLLRRALLHAVGMPAVLAAIAEVFPLGTVKALAQEAAGGKPERPKLTVGFVPITCTTPLLLAQAMGEYQREGLTVNLVRTPSWALVRDKMISGEFDLSHLVLGLPLTMELGIGAPATKIFVSTVQNVNGNALVLHARHKGNRDPKAWKGMRFGIPHEHSMHAMLLRYYLADNGLDPDRDVDLRVFPPPDSVANMAAGNLDGMLFAEPWGQRAVFEGIGFIHLLTRDIYADHPCCTLAVSERFVAENPNSYGAMFRAVARATEFADRAENRNQVAEMLAPAAYLNQPLTVLQQVMTGRYADGLGNVVSRPDRIGFKALPDEATAVWLLTQLRRWNIVPMDVNYRAVAQQVFRSTDAAARIRAAGLPLAPATPDTGHSILGKPFDPAETAQYITSFAIRHSG